MNVMEWPGLRQSEAIAAELEGVPALPPDTKRRNWLTRALMELPTEQRVTLELTDYCGYSCEEIASIMVCPVSTVKARMFYARERLRAVLPDLASSIATRR